MYLPDHDVSIQTPARQRPARITLAQCLLLSVALLVAACGGGSGSGSGGSGGSGGGGGGGGSSSMQLLTVTNGGHGTVSSAPTGITCPSTCATSFAQGTSVSLTAAPTSGYVFSGWSGACTGSVSPCVVAMTGSEFVTASFAATGSIFSLSVANTGSGSGIVSSDTGTISCGTTCSGNYSASTLVTLTAAATTSSAFSGWTGACSGTSARCVVTMSAAQSVTANFVALGSTCTSTGATNLATMDTNASDAYTTNTSLTSSCASDTLGGGAVTGICYGNYAVQVNAYSNPPASTNFSMWSQSAGCWGINTTSANTGLSYWNAPLVTRGFSFGYDAPLTSTGGILVSSFDTQYANATTPCPSSGTSSSVCVKWAMSVPGVAAQSTVNTASSTNTNWDALLDIYFHTTATPASSDNVVFDLQVYQMVMDWQASGNPNWATYEVGTGHYSLKTISGVTYLVAVNMQDPGTETNWVGNGTGGTTNAVSMFALPTYPSTVAAGGTGSYLWGTPSVVHDVGGIIAWLSQVKTVGGVTGIFDDAGNLLYDYYRQTGVTSPLISPSFYLTGLNPGYEVVQVAPSSISSYPNNAVYTTTDYWVALPGETVGN